MNESHFSHRIWQPSVVVVTESAAPLAASSNQQQQHQYYTKSSLKSSTAEAATTTTSSGSFSRQQQQQSSANREFDLRKSLNAEILNVSQAHNNTPKPFARLQQQQQQQRSPSGSSRNSPLLVRQEATQRLIGADQFSERSTSEAGAARQSAFTSNLVEQQVINKCDGSSQSSTLGKRRQEEEQAENMAPQKLVHKQYNSPIDLYSMNNIRKTIEAHTELIAPGIKGINFMKPEAPVNKQSEVYKLVMEEEQRSRSQQTPSRLSPISGQPLSMPTALVESAAQQQQQHDNTRHLSATIQRNQQESSQQQCEFSQRQHQQQQQLQQHGSFGVATIQKQQQQQQQQQFQAERQQQQTKPQVPTCCECGQFIVGPFARIQNRSVHPQCFNCTTCGTSLKNTGYFTVNEKLYCEIHAKQVAQMMHRQYDYAAAVEQRNSQIASASSHQVAKQQQCASSQQSTTTFSHQHQQQHQQQLKVSHQASPAPEVSTSSTSASDLAGARQSGFSSSSPATISTMFADRSKSEVRWAPTLTKQSAAAEVATSSSASAGSLRASSLSSYQQQEQQQQLHSQQQSVIGVRGRGLLQDGSVPYGGRVPVCCHCHVQIQGPYILAGKTTWCKLCSQTNFNCTSCRRSLLDIGFIEDNQHKYYCEHCFEAYYAPICFKCNLRIKGDCLNALNKQWHPSCFICGHCRRPFGNSSFYLEDNVPYCERDWNVLFTTKCYACSYPIEAGDKWIEALERNYHSNCFRCTSCQVNLEGSTFYCKGGKPYCRLHAR